MDETAWSSTQLTSFLAALSRSSDEHAAAQVGVERAAEALEAEVAALLSRGRALASIGFGRAPVPDAALAQIARGKQASVDVPGVGACDAVAVPVEGLDEAFLLLARSCPEGFSREEISLLRGMATVLGLSLRSIVGLAAERRMRERSERQAELLERLGALQHLIATRAPLQNILDAVTAGAAKMLGEDIVGLRLIDPAAPHLMRVASSYGAPAEVLERTRVGAVGEGIGGRAIAQGRLVVADDYAAEGGLPAFVELGVRTSMAAPVMGSSGPFGSLVVSSLREGRRFSSAEQDVLVALAELTGLALNDAQTVAALRTAVDEARHQASHDALTSLPNRVLFRERLAQVVARSRRTRGTIAVLFIDLDDFKTLNDSLGHAAGDELLRAVASRLRGALRACDLAARLGGDEFAVLLEDLQEERSAVSTAERLLDALRQPFRLSSREVFTRASIGIACSAGGADEPADLLRNADVAMYSAKAAGAGRYAVFEPAMQATVQARMDLEDSLHRALDQSEFTLRYQPIVELSTRSIRGVEALARWQHPVHGLLLPELFVPAAEATGLIVPLGAWVLEEACRQLAEWRASVPAAEDLRLSVNVSPAQLILPGYRDGVRNIIRGAGLACSDVTLEVTEGVLVRDQPAMLDTLTDLRGLGVRLAVDDFGTGYSALGYLRHFPVDVLKMDKAFVEDLRPGTGEPTLAHVIVDLGRALGLETVAEGVQSDYQASRLLRLGCLLGQGTLFSAPLAAEQAGQLIAARQSP